MELSEQDIAQIEKRGSTIENVSQQIDNFKTGFPFLNVIEAATLENGIIALGDTALEGYISFFDELALKKKLLKFVPASGAASRMFKSLYAAKDEGKSDASVEEFQSRIKEFAFYNSLQKVKKGETHADILKALLEEDGLDYGNLPKGLLEFHLYGDTTRTAVEEHMIEGALYANNKGKVKLHFTVSPEHKRKFKALISEVQPKYEKEYNVKFVLSFSEQKASTDTIAVDLNNEPFRNDDGSVLFRPAGHGALLENLNEQDADIVFIKNIDNVVPDHIKEETIKYKKALAGLLLSYQKQVFTLLRRLDKPEPSPYMVNKCLRYIKTTLCVVPPKGIRNWPFEDKLNYAKTKLSRPFRICGMVKNVGEPGGGPFWAKNEDGSVSLQVVESAQINMSDKKQKTIFETATHFNPVDLICSFKDYKKQPFNLLEFRDPKTGFITEKSMSGKSLKAQELPGLWNGSMANWNTLFVEVPLITFNPVKTVNDLLRTEHQPVK